MIKLFHGFLSGFSRKPTKISISEGNIPVKIRFYKEGVESNILLSLPPPPPLKGQCQRLLGPNKLKPAEQYETQNTKYS